MLSLESPDSRFLYTGYMLRIHLPLPADSLRLLVFDLDGTLIDSRQDLCNSVNATLENFGLPELTDDVIAGFIGDGAAMLIRRALGVPGEVPGGPESLDEAFFQEAFEYFLTYYRAHKLDFTTVYPGVMESLESLRTLPDGSQRQMAVLTNKPVGPAAAICEGLGLSPYFFKVYGGDSFATKKPDPLGLVTLMAEAGVAPRETLMIGDSEVDIQAARNAGVWSLGCTFGLSPDTVLVAGPDVLVDHAAEWAVALDGSANAA
jgi:phosphoglycolate phosphatase